MCELESAIKYYKNTLELKPDFAEAYNSLGMAYKELGQLDEAIICYEQGVASADSIDEIMVLGMSHPMGPLRLADLIGLDICLNIMNVLYDGFNDKKYKPSRLLSDMVSSGTLGKKTGEGFYRY